MGSRSLDDLDPRFKPIAEELLHRSKAANWACIVVNTLRDLDEQKRNVAKGVSWTLDSKHLPQPPYQKSWAIDLVPERLVHEKYWAPDSPGWALIGSIGRELGLEWGVWVKIKGVLVNKDQGHFQWSPPVAKKKSFWKFW